MFGSLLGTLGCSTFFYYPISYEMIDRNELPQQPQDIHFQTAAGAKLHGWLFRHKSESAEPPEALLLHFHGNAQNLSTHFLNFYFVIDERLDYFIFDYQGYGQSEGSPSPSRTVEDGLAALRWAKENYPSTPIIVVGQSIGGAIALKSLIEFKKKEKLPDIALIMIDSSFSDYKSVAASTLAKSWLTWWLQPLAWFIVDNSQSVDSELSDLSGYPILVVHGTSDQVISYQQGERLFSLLPEPKKFLTVKNGHHTDLLARNGGKHRAQWLKWVRAVLAQRKFPEDIAERSEI